MANRYWVGGTANWDGTAGTKWSATSGGAGGASVPTTADDVFFSAASTGTVTIASGNLGAKSINCTGFTGTITGTASIIVAGSITLVTGQGFTHTGIVTMTGTGTLTTAGKNFGALTISGAGITVTLGSALNTVSRNITLTEGTFNTANYNVTAYEIISSNTNTRTLTLGSSTLTLNGINPIDFVTSTNLTVTAGTSQINLTNVSPTFDGGGKTFYNVSFTNTSIGIRVITGANTFNNLTSGVGATGLTQLSLADDQTVNGTFTCDGGSAIARGFVRSSVVGTTRTITAAVLSASNCDFRDITLAGAAAGSAPSRAGDCGGNSGITFPAGKTVYRVGTVSNWASTASWAPTPNGTAGNLSFPLAQDIAVIDDSTTNTGTLSFNAAYNVGTLDASARTTGITFNFGAQFTYYGDFTFGSGVTVTGDINQNFLGRGTQTFTSAGKTITFAITVDKPAGAFELGDAFVSSSSITHTRGTFDAKNYNVTCTTVACASGNTRTLTMGSGLWTLSGTGTVWNFGATGLTFNKNTANILLSNTSTTARVFTGGNLVYNKLTIGGASGVSTTTIGSGNTFSELASTKTVAHTITLAANQTITTWTVTGTAGNVVTLNSSVVGGRRTITLTNPTSGINYLSVKDIGIASANRFYVGANSTDGGNNLNVIFTAAPSGSQIYYGSINVTSLNYGSSAVTAVYYGSTKVF